MELYEKLGLKSEEELIENGKKILKLLKNQSNLSYLPDQVTDSDIEPNNVLAGAYDRLKEVVLVGVDKDDCYFFASSSGSSADILWLLEKIKSEVLFKSQIEE